jgi:betR domain
LTKETDMNVVQKELSRRIAAGGYSVRGYAKRLGISRTTFARKLSGETEFTLADMQKIASSLGYDSVSAMLSDAEQRCADEAAASALADVSPDGYEIQDSASGSVILQARRVDWDGGDAA